jgi:hypothetical protein
MEEQQIKLWELTKEDLKKVTLDDSVQVAFNYLLKQLNYVYDDEVTCTSDKKDNLIRNVMSLFGRIDEDIIDSTDRVLFLRNISDAVIYVNKYKFM